MKLTRIMEILDAQLITGTNAGSIEVNEVCSTDLMSDVLCLNRSPQLLLTGLTNPQSVRTAEMAEIPAVCFVHGKRPPPETVELATKTGINLLATRWPAYAACGKLYAAGLSGCDGAGE